ncbi:hypothetical protein E9993_06320 [Labilibacter sediminis]|nr:hypothetical protein E9993_06320 [Labilibacter sediminis]
MNYLLVKNGFVVKGSEIITEDILVGGNKILQMGEGIDRPTSDTPVIDASDKYIIPGAIDMNRHFLDLVANDASPDELVKLNQAQIFNGTTTMLDALEDCYEKNYLYNIYKAKEKSKKNMIDYGFHLTFADLKKSTANAFDYSYIHEGISTFWVNIAQLVEEKREVLDDIFAHAANHQLLIVCDLSLPEVRKSDVDDIALSNPEALKRHFLTLSKVVEMGIGFACPVLFMNVKFKEELELIQEALKKGGNFFASLSLPFAIGFSDQVIHDDHQVITGIASANSLVPIWEEEVLSLLQSSRYLINPPVYNLTFEEDSSEELVYNRPDKYFYLRNHLSMLYTVGVMQNKITMQQLVDIVSTRPSKMMGLWPQKGLLQHGSDADFVIWNPTFDRNLYCSLPNAEHPSGESFKLQGRPDFVFVKGRMLYNGETFYPKQSDGSFVFRTAKIFD